jgi:hypothetical protein
MGRCYWPATWEGHYWIDVALGPLEVRVMIDIGLVDPLHQQGFEIEPGIFDQLKRTGQFTRLADRSRRDASGRTVRTENGRATAQLLDPATRQRVGPKVDVNVSRGAPHVPSRAGVVFFHKLTGCRVLWDLDSRTWCVEYP